MAISGVVLAGGQAQRMGRVNKGLIHFHGAPLISHVLQRIAPQVDEIIINANANLSAYRAFGHALVSDAPVYKHAGPLAGILAGLQNAKHQWVLFVPVDAPYLPLNLAQRLTTALHEQPPADLAFAYTASGEQPVFCLGNKNLAMQLEGFLQRGGRKVLDWQNSVAHRPVLFKEETAFHNINQLSDLTCSETC